MRATQGFEVKKPSRGRDCADVWEEEKFGLKADRREILGGEQEKK